MDWPSLGIIAVTVFGAVVGSFLNVVIYRLPRGLSIASPHWSFCPHCRGTIPAHLNIPIFGWLALRGRCRACRAPIDMIYPLIEVATALVFLMLWDAMFVGKVMPGLGEVSKDWPMLVGYLVLFAALLASAAMDLESYTIHIQVLLAAVLVGVLAYTTRGLPIPPPPAGGQTPYLLPPSLCAVSLAMGAAWVVSCFAVKRRMQARHDETPPAPPSAEPAPQDNHETHSLSDEIGPVNAPQREQAAPNWRFQPLPVVLLTAAVIGLAAWQIMDPLAGLSINIPPAGQRVFVACFILMLMIVLASLVHREVDRLIIEDLERERPQARSMAWSELVEFLPALIVGLLILALLRQTSWINVTWRTVCNQAASHGPLVVHVVGGLYALSAAILSAALGWSVRILGTLAFRKEAFGSGDIYILAAIGAVGGFWLVVIGFLLSAILALVGVLATSFRKSSRAIPFGPWLALGAFAGLWLQAPLVSLFSPIGWVLWRVLSGQPTWEG